MQQIMGKKSFVWQTLTMTDPPLDTFTPILLHYFTSLLLS